MGALIFMLKGLTKGNFTRPEKIINTYDNEMKLIRTDRFDLVDTTIYDIAFDSLDLVVLQEMESFRVIQKVFLDECKLCKKNYRGLRSVR